MEERTGEKGAEIKVGLGRVKMGRRWKRWEKVEKEIERERMERREKEGEELEGPVGGSVNEENFA